MCSMRIKFWVKWRFFGIEHHELMDIVFMMIKYATIPFSWPPPLVCEVRAVHLGLQGCSGTDWMGRWASQMSLTRALAHCTWHLGPIWRGSRVRVSHHAIHRHPGSVLLFYNFSRCLILKVVEKTQSWASRRIYQAQQRKHNLLHWRPTLQDRKRRRYVCMLTPTTQVPNYYTTRLSPPQPSSVSPALALSVTNTCTHSFSCVRCLPSI